MLEASRYKDIEIECDLFERPHMILCYGGSYSGKTHMIVNLIKRYHEKFKKIIICGAKNGLLTDEATKHKSVFYENEDSPIYDPFQDSEGLSANDPKLLILDDLMSEVYSSQLASKIFSKGRHLNLTTIIILQSFYPQGCSKSIVPMLKNNANLQIFFKLRNRSEMNLVGKKLEHSKKNQQFFEALVHQEIYQKRFGYLAVFMDETEARYRNNLVYEDSLPYETVFLK